MVTSCKYDAKPVFRSARLNYCCMDISMYNKRGESTFYDFYLISQEGNALISEDEVKPYLDSIAFTHFSQVADSMDYYFVIFYRETKESTVVTLSRDKYLFENYTSVEDKLASYIFRFGDFVGVHYYDSEGNRRFYRKAKYEKGK
jgi:hypothetical protein